MIRLAKESDLDQIVLLAERTRKDMLRQGLKQWPGNYPNLDYFKNDLSQEGLYIYKEGETILASITLLLRNDPPYEELSWRGTHSLVIHRLVVRPDVQRQGIGRKMFSFATQLATENGYDSILVDTHPDNIKMQRLIQTSGFEYVGYLSSINRLAYEIIL